MRDRERDQTIHLEMLTKAQLHVFRATTHVNRQRKLISVLERIDASDRCQKRRNFCDISRMRSHYILKIAIVSLKSSQKTRRVSREDDDVCQTGGGT